MEAYESATASTATTAAKAAASTATSDATARLFAERRRRVAFSPAVEPYQPGTASSPVLLDQSDNGTADTAAVQDTATAAADAGTSMDAVVGTEVVQCAGITAKGTRCKVCSVGSSAPAFISAPLRNGARCCTMHRGQ